jgi:DNA-binding NarL/FixJ family response regulator
MKPIDTLLVTRNQVYKEALMLMLRSDRLIRPISPSDFGLPLPPSLGKGSHACVVLFDLSNKRISFPEYAAEIERRNLSPAVLLYGDDGNDQDLLYYLSCGARGFLLGDELGNLLVTAVKHVADGGLWMPHKIVAQFVRKVVAEFHYVSKLFRVPNVASPREQEVWGLINQGRSNKEIACSLNITERTVKFHVTQLLSKFQVTDRRKLMLLDGLSGQDLNRKRIG